MLGFAMDLRFSYYYTSQDISILTKISDPTWTERHI